MRGLIASVLARLVRPTAPVAAAVRVIRAKYDAARTTDQNEKHWAMADDLGPVAANSPDVRRQIRRRARYERANNSYLNGLVKTMSHDMVGTGPRLQLQLPAAEGVADRSTADSLAGGFAARRIERAFREWSRAAGVPEILRLMHEACVTDGEVFGVIATDETVRHPVKLTLRPIECDRVAHAGAEWAGLGGVDGIEYDEAGNPTRYSVLKQHPGDGWAAMPGEASWWPASRVLHWFRPDRPGQCRGVSWLAPALTLAPQLRRYTLATVLAAELAATIAGVLQTELPPVSGEATAPDSMDRIEYEPGALLTLPTGVKLSQLKAEQPVETYGGFKHEILNEMGRGLNAPFNVIAGNSSGYNYSSARLDHQIYHRSVWIERDRMQSRVIDPLFVVWLEFARLTPQLADLFVGLPPVEQWAWDWHWDGFTSIDPVKDAKAADDRLRLNLTTLAEECAADGKDWQEVLGQRAAELKYAKGLGLADPNAVAQAVPPAAVATPQHDGEQSTDSQSAGA